MGLLAMKPERLLEGSGAVTEVIVASVFLAPISMAVGVPVLLAYALKKPAIRSRTVHLAACAISLLSYGYLVWLDHQFRSSS